MVANGKITGSTAACMSRRLGLAMRCAALVGTAALSGCAGERGADASRVALAHGVRGPVMSDATAPPMLAAPRDQAGDCHSETFTFVTACGGAIRYQGP